MGSVRIFAAICVAASAFSGCEQPPPKSVLACESAVKAFLRSPSTYKRINSTGLSDYAFVEYDAANAYGTPIRGVATCKFDEGTDKFSSRLADFSMPSLSETGTTKTYQTMQAKMQMLAAGW